MRAGTCLNERQRLIRGLSSNKLPDIAIERAELLLHFEKCFGILHGGGNFQPVANDAGVFQQALHLALVVSGHFFGVEVIERRAVVFALLENRLPAQSGLRAFENQKFEEPRDPLCSGTPHSLS